ncbi:MCE family protein [Nocardioides sp. R-C-SC26]|uniref:MCE family protein n=1 Tax=Nocardioides sp. R-C-SC26 TaxID=2870414 RepID=UPI001E2CC10F|nr:MCE family protein [Nocardioides sp. R-C-SC26]
MTVPSRYRRVAGAGVGVSVLAIALSACSTTLGDLPLPGTTVRGDTVSVEAEFVDALNLAQGATVKVNGVASGKVRSVRAEDFHAVAELVVESDAGLRDGVTARLRYDTPLGELFVDMTNPDAGAPLADGDVIELDDTSTAPTVEDSLSQASLLVNGGGLDQLQTISEELNTALGGREDVARSLLERLDRVLTEANESSADIDRALRSLASVSGTLRERQDVIDRAVREITPAARVLRENTPELTELLGELETFSATAGDFVAAIRDDTIRVLDQAVPVLDEFSKQRRSYPESLEKLAALGPIAESFVPNDYAAITIANRLEGSTLPSLGDILANLGIPIPIPDLPPLPGLPGGRAASQNDTSDSRGADRQRKDGSGGWLGDRLGSALSGILGGRR